MIRLQYRPEHQLPQAWLKLRRETEYAQDLARRIKENQETIARLRAQVQTSDIT